MKKECYDVFDRAGERVDDDARALTRRDFTAGLASLFAASAFSLSVPEATAAQVQSGDDSATQTVTSPDGRVAITVDTSDGTLTYSVTHDDQPIVEDASLGFTFQNQAPFGDGLAVTGSERSATDETWEPIWDQYDEIHEQYRELRLGLRETGDPGRAITFEVRAFDDGVAFRYVFPESGGFGEFAVTSERTEFAFTGDHTAWWIPNDPNSYEYRYRETSLSAIGAESDFGGAHTPITMRTNSGRYVSVHEADLVDYATMSVAPTESGATTVTTDLAPLPDGTKVTASAPHRTPWRTIQIGERPGDLIESNLIVNCNEDYDPEEFPQGTDWIEPQTFIGVWWLMITGRADWEYTGMQSGNHGAQTGRVKQYMDFASEHGIPSVLVEGWNQGWSTYPDGGGSAFDFTESYPDFDLQEVTSYGPALDPPTQMTMHNETAGGFRNYESQIDEAFALYDDLGIRTIKSGYVRDAGDLAGEGHNHHNQVLVNHHHLVARTAAANRQMLDIHEPIHPTGRRRRYPNLMTREGVFGQEYDSFGDIPPEHHVTFPFTRMLGGPVEFTPGIFDMDSGSGGVESTRTKQLAMYPTYFSGLQMAADLPSSYLADRPAEVGVGTVTQAEFGRLDGLETAAHWANAQGERYVAFDPNSAPAGSTVTWDLTDAGAGEYDLHLRYASDAENNAVPADTERTATITVDGEPVTQVTVPATEYWDVWNSVSATITLEEGSETVGVALTDDDSGGFNLDAVALTPTGEAMPEPETAPIRGPTVPEFKFIEDVPAAGWDDTSVVDAAIGDYSIVAREKDGEWFVGAMTDESGRALDVPLDFLDEAPGERRGHDGNTGHGHGQGEGSGDGPGKGKDRGKKKGTGDNGTANGKGRGHTKGHYVAEIYSDGIDASYDENLADVRIDEAVVDADTTVLASMIETGGTAIRLRPAEREDLEALPAYERPEQDVSITLADETFVRESFITATGSNPGDYIGGTTVDVLVDGERVRTTNVRFPPNTDAASDEIGYTIEQPGTYDVAVRTADGETLASGSVTVKPPETVATIADPAGDDSGPGSYTYPTADAFRDGAFDLLSVEVARTPSIARFTFEVANLYDVFGGRFSPHMFLLWVRDPAASGGTTESLDDLGANVTFGAPWQYRLRVDGFNLRAVDAAGAALTGPDGSTISPRVSVDFEANTVTLDIDRAAFDGADPADLELVAAVGSEDFGTLRSVAVDAGGYTFGGADPDAVENAPPLLDVTTPDGVAQSDALAYSADALATLPFVAIDGV